MGRTSGFTLVEIMLVLTIIGLLLAFPASGYYRVWFPGFKLKTSTLNLYFTFVKARQQALSQHRDFGLRFREPPGENPYYQVFNSEGVVATTYLPADIKYYPGEITFGGDREMIFKAAGTAEGGHVTLTNERGNSYEISVYGVTARISYEKWEK